MKKIILTWLTAFALLLITKNAFAQYPIPATLFGINGWMNSFIGDGTNVYNCNGLSATFEPNQWNCYLGGKVDAIMTGACSPVVKDLHVNMIRYGGISNDINFPTYDQFINEIDRIRALGAEPIIQIPYYDGKYSATNAYDLLYYLNTTRGKNIKYVEIGNEPDKYPGYPLGQGSTDQIRANYIHDYFYPIACSLKVADANVQIIGPSCSWYNAGVYKHLLTSNDAASLIGTDGSGRYVLDIVDIHRYPFDGSQDRGKVIDDPANSTGTYTFGTCFASVLTSGSCTTTTAGLLDYISCANGSRSSPLKFSVSEMNVNWQNPSSNGISGYATNSFIAGQWMADMYSVILDKARATGVDVAFVAPWSFLESGGLNGKYDYGVLDNTYACTDGKRSTYEHLRVMGQYFKGNFYKGTNNTKPKVKQFGTVQSNGDYVIMLLNEDDTYTYPYTINTGTSTVGTTSLVVTLGSPTNYTYTYSTGIPPKTTHLVFLNCNGGFVQTLKYNETIAGLTPAHGTFTTETGSGNLPVSLTTGAMNTGCTTTYSATGSASVAATSGTAPYTYTWSPAGFTGGNTATYSNLPAGTYTVAVSSSSTVCTAPQTATVIIAQGSPLVSVTTPTNANSCAATQAFTSSVTGGTSPYTYSWSGGGGTGSVSATYTQTGAQNTANEYTLTVTDAHGCANTALCTHYQTNSVTVTGTPTANVCCTITLTATYIAGATYTWTQNGLAINANTYPSVKTHILTGGLGSGTFVVTATNGNLNPCTSAPSATFVVTTPGGRACTCPQGPVGKLSNTASVGENTPEGSAIDGLIPNPTSNATIITYHLNDNVSKAVVVVSDLMGREKERLHLNPNSRQVDLSCDGYSEGIYFVTLLTDNQKVSTKKLMIVK